MIIVIDSCFPELSNSFSAACISLLKAIIFSMSTCLRLPVLGVSIAALFAVSILSSTPVIIIIPVCHWPILQVMHPT